MATHFSSIEDTLANLNKDVGIDDDLVRCIALQKLFQVDVREVYNNSLDDFGLTSASNELPSFTKALADVPKAINFWTGIADCAWGSSGYLMEPFQTQIDITGLVPEQVFFAEGTKNTTVHEIEELWNNCTPANVKFISLVGGKKRIYGEKISNQTAEKTAKTCISAFPKCKIVFLCVKIAQRSFSIPEIDVVHLMFDRGSIAGNNQKGSRCKTAKIGRNNKVAKIIAWSLDPKRDNKIELVFLDEAVRSAKNNNISLEKARHTVFASMPMFRVGKSGLIKIEESVYMAHLDDQSSFDAVCARNFNVGKLPASAISLIESLEIDPKNNKEPLPEHRFKLGKTFKDKTPPKKSCSGKNDEKKLIEFIKLLSTNGVNTLKECRFLFVQDKKLTLDELIEKISLNKMAIEWWLTVADYEFDLFAIFVKSECWGYNNNYLRNVVEL